MRFIGPAYFRVAKTDNTESVFAGYTPEDLINDVRTDCNPIWIPQKRKKSLLELNPYILSTIFRKIPLVLDLGNSQVRTYVLTQVRMEWRKVEIKSDFNRVKGKLYERTAVVRLIPTNGRFLCVELLPRAQVDHFNARGEILTVVKDPVCCLIGLHPKAFGDVSSGKLPPVPSYGEVTKNRARSVARVDYGDWLN